MQRAQTNFKIDNLNWKADALDWIGDAIEEIGYHTGFEKKEGIKLKVKNFRCKVPYYIIALSSVHYEGARLALVTDGETEKNDLYGMNYGLASDNHVVDLNKEWKRLEELRDMYEASPVQSTLDAIIECQRKIELLVNNVMFYGRSSHLRAPWYRINAGYIHTSFPEGEIELSGKCFMVDEKGYPMTVDTLKYRKAIEWSIIYQLLLQGYEHPVITLEFAYREKDIWISQAGNEPHIMSEDRMENFANQWTSIKRDAQLITLGD